MALVLHSAYLTLAFWLKHFSFGAHAGIAVPVILAFAMVELLRFSVYILIGVVLFSAVLSWVNPHAPLAPLFNNLSRPFLRPFQRLIPPIAGVDLTPLVLLLVLQIVRAFALGSRASLHNLVAGHFMRRLIRPGDSLKLPEVEGVVVRYFGVCVVVRTAHGEVTVPCKVLLDQNVGLERLGAKERARQEAEPAPASDLPG